MKKIHQDLEVKSFEKPDGIVTVKICKATGRKATDKCSDTYSEIFSKDSIPEDCNGHKTVKTCKDTGKIATEFCPNTEDKTYGVVIDTEKDANWSPKLSETEEPTDTCDVHTSAPKISVPSVVGKTQEQATKELQAAGFKVKVTKSDDKNKSKGIVLSQSEKNAVKGAEITIVVNQYDGGKKNESIETNTGKNNTTTEKPSKNENTTSKPTNTVNNANTSSQNKTT